MDKCRRLRHDSHRVAKKYEVLPKAVRQMDTRPAEPETFAVVELHAERIADNLHRRWQPAANRPGCERAVGRLREAPESLRPSLLSNCQITVTKRIRKCRAFLFAPTTSTAVSRFASVGGGCEPEARPSPPPLQATLGLFPVHRSLGAGGYPSSSFLQEIRMPLG
jgi:hypothetical protein